MRVIENECVGCPDDIGCIYDTCKYYRIVRYYCDRCGIEVDEGELYYFGPEELCAECILNELEKVVYNDE